MIAIELVTPGTFRHHVGPLAAILADSVADGAAISFMQPFTAVDAAEFLRTAVLPQVECGGRLLFAAALDGVPCGTAQLVLAMPPNQPHRCEIAKMAVHPAARRRGVARRLMEAAEAEARARGKTLITLDTRTGDRAEPLYAACGFAAAGVIPGYALDPDGGATHGTTYMYKVL